jgi:hypothetical protein
LTQISEYWGNVTKCGGILKFSTLGEASDHVLNWGENLHNCNKEEKGTKLME